MRLIIWRNRQATPRWRLVDRETKAETEAEIERERENNAEGAPALARPDYLLSLHATRSRVDLARSLFLDLVLGALALCSSPRTGLRDRPILGRGRCGKEWTWRALFLDFVLCTLNQIISY